MFGQTYPFRSAQMDSMCQWCVCWWNSIWAAACGQRGQNLVAKNAECQLIMLQSIIISHSTEPLLQGNSGNVIEEYQALEKLSDELRKIEKTLSLLLNNRKEEEKPGYWTSVAKKVNRVFFIFYVTVVTLFLIVIFFKWNDAQNWSLLDNENLTNCCLCMMSYSNS